MKRVSVEIIPHKGNVDCTIWMKNNVIFIETSDVMASTDLYQFAIYLLNKGSIKSFEEAEPKYEFYQIQLKMLDGFKGNIEATYILTHFHAGEEIFNN